MTPNELRALAEALDRLKFRCDGIDDACLVEDAADYLRACADAEPVTWIAHNLTTGHVKWTTDRCRARGWTRSVNLRVKPLYAHPAPAVPQAEPIADSDADYWLRNRQAILDAIERAGFVLMSNASGFWLHPRGTTDAQAEPKREPLSDEQIEIPDYLRLQIACTAAAHDVLVERRRQIEAEGWTPEHDDEHDGGELACAAAAYALDAGDKLDQRPPDFWPWYGGRPREVRWWKPSDRRRNLVKAGALILAEIERLDRIGGGNAE